MPGGFQSGITLGIRFSKYHPPSGLYQLPLAQREYAAAAVDEHCPPYIIAQQDNNSDQAAGGQLRDNSHR